MPDGDAMLRLRQVKPELDRLDAPLGGFTGSNETVFLEIGHILSQAIDAFGRMSGEFAELAEELHSHEGGSAAAALERAAEAISSLSLHGLQDSVAMLARLEAGTKDVEKQLELLIRIVGEIRALGINGKIQAAQVSAAGVDFSVFTTEIGRLGQMAETSTAQAGARMTDVRSAVASALQSTMAFEQSEAKELVAVRERIEGSLAAISQRRRAVAVAADSVAVRSQEISRRIAMTVGELQINDNVNQRIEHVRSALKEVGGWLDGRAAPACSALTAVSQESRLAFLGGFFRLCIAQLDSGAGDYGDEVGGLIRNLKGLASDAARILSDAEAAFGSVSGGLFVAEIEADIRRASELLSIFSEKRERTYAVVMSVSQSIEAMSDDLASIRSIDADLRIMGLNATLKCGRLGNDGRALGVVSHELRVCSKRTEDGTQIIATLLETVLTLSHEIGKHSAVLEGQADPGLMISDSLDALCRLGQVLSKALDVLRADCGRISSDLSSAAEQVTIHHRLSDIVKDIVSSLKLMLEEIGPLDDMDDASHQNLIDLIYSKYTMNRERLVHKAFAKGHVELTVEEQATASDVELDDLFL